MFFVSLLLWHSSISTLVNAFPSYYPLPELICTYIHTSFFFPILLFISKVASKTYIIHLVEHTNDERIMQAHSNAAATINIGLTLEQLLIGNNAQNIDWSAIQSRLEPHPKEASPLRRRPDSLPSHNADAVLPPLPSTSTNRHDPNFPRHPPRRRRPEKLFWLHPPV